MTETERAPIDWSKPMETEDGRKVNYLSIGPTSGHRWVEIAQRDGSVLAACSNEHGLCSVPISRGIFRIRNVAPPAPKTVERGAWAVFRPETADVVSSWSGDDKALAVDHLEELTESGETEKYGYVLAHITWTEPADDPQPVAWKVFNEDGSDCQRFDYEGLARAEYERRMKQYRTASPFPHPYAFIQPIYADPKPTTEGWRVRNEDGSEAEPFATEAAALSAFERRFDAWRRRMPVFEKAGGDDDLE